MLARCPSKSPETIHGLRLQSLVNSNSWFCVDYAPLFNRMLPQSWLLCYLQELKLKCGSDFEAFFGDHEILPEPKSSVTGVETDGLGGYDAAGYRIADTA